MADSEVQWKSHRLKLIENTDGTYSIATAVGSGAPDQEVVGNVAHDAVDMGSPVKIGGRARTSLPPVVTSDDRVDAYFTAYGQLGVSPLVTTQPSDGDTAYRQGSLAGSGVAAVAGMAFNGTTWDRIRGDTTGVHVVPRATVVEVTATPTIDTAIFASGDVLHSTIITFTGAVRAAGGTGTIIGFTVYDYDLEQSPLELWLATTSITIPAANAAWSVSDADAANIIGVLPSGIYYASALNAVARSQPVVPFKAAGGATAIYGALVTRGTPTYTNATDIKVGLLIAQD